MKKFNYYCLIVALSIAFLNTWSSFFEDIKVIDESLKDVYKYSSISYLIIAFTLLLFTFFKKYKEISVLVLYISTVSWGVMTQFCIPSGYLTFVIVSFFYSLFHGVNFKKQAFLISFFGILNLIAINSTNSLNKMADLKDQFQYDYSATVVLFSLIIIVITFFKNKQVKEKELIENKFIDAGSRTSIFIHDLKNMVVPIKNNVEYLKMNEEELIDTEYKQTTKDISDSVKDLLLFIKEYNQSFSFKQETGEINLTDIINSFRQVYKNKINNVNISVQQEGNFVCDLNILKSILSNLIINSCDAFQEKNIQNKSIVISFKNNNLTYLDTAGGIPEDKLKLIQEDSFFSTKQNGSGIGIFTIKKYISLLDWKITFQNKDNGLLVSIALKK